MPLTYLAQIETRVGSLDVYRGHDRDVISQLGEKAQSDRMRHSVPRDSAERFKDPDSFAHWVAKGGGRSTYPALDPNRLRRGGQWELAVFCWLGREAFPAGKYELPPELSHLRADHTYAIRSYGLQGGDEAFYEGVGAASRVSRVAIADYAGTRLVEAAATLQPQGLEPAIFLETDADNPARTGLYAHMYGSEGWIDLGEDESGQRAGMVLPYSTIAAHGIPLPDEFASN